MGKAFPPFIFPGVDRHGAQSDPAAPYIQFFPVFIKQRDHRPIQRLLTVAMRPPAFRVLHCDSVPVLFRLYLLCRIPFHSFLRRLSSDQFPVPVIERRPDLEVLLFVKVLNRHIKVNFHFGFRPLLCYVNLFQSCLSAGQNRYFTENSHIRQSRTPIPPEHTMGLPEMRISFHAFR